MLSLLSLLSFLFPVPHSFIFMWWTFVVVAIVVPCIGSLVILSYYLVKVIEKSNKKKLTKTSG